MSYLKNVVANYLIWRSFRLQPTLRRLGNLDLHQIPGADRSLSMRNMFFTSQSIITMPIVKGFIQTIVMIVALLPHLVEPVAAETIGLTKALEKVVPGDLLAKADGFGAVLAGYPIAPILEGNKVVGHAFLNKDFSGTIGYSGKPIVVLIALDLDGNISGARLVEHAEPIVLAGIPEKKIIEFIDAYKSLNIPKLAATSSSSPPPADIVSGATVTVMVIDDSIKRASIRAARALSIGGLTSEKTARVTIIKSVDTSFDDVVDWQTLFGNGSVRRLRLTVGDVNETFDQTGNEKAIARPEAGAPEETFIDLYAASLSVPGVARSLLGKAEYENLKRRLKPGRDAFLIMGNGRYSFKGSGYVRGGIFDRIQVIQGENSLRFRDRGHKRLADVLAAGAPRFKEVALFTTPKEASFDPAEPWRLQLLVSRAVGALKKVFITYDLSYQLPKKYIHVEKIAAAPIPSSAVAAPAVTPSLVDDETARTELWMRIWEQKTGKIIILTLSIVLLTIIFFFQDYLTLSTIWTDRIRTGFLIFTLFWIGFYAQAQLSIVNVFVFVNAVMGTFRWEYFLMEPLIFILWCSVATSLIFWGRGAYCGWLCPFGALQELLNKIAKWANIRQLALPWGLHERLWPVKYIIFLGLLGVSLSSIAYAERLAEVEPFKTVIILKFMREWPYLMFAVAVLIPCLFIERFYCRYLCPLGAALAIPGRLAMFHWLKRYRNCGDPCHLCARDCPVQAIDPLGDINPNECIHCLNCQQMYNNKHVCPVVINKLAKAKKNVVFEKAPKAMAKGQADPASKTKPNLNAPQGIQETETLFRRPRRLGRSRSIE